ncbi:dGTP triphosphohydrolase [Bradyrhizobium elkanii]
MRLSHNLNTGILINPNKPMTQKPLYTKDDEWRESATEPPKTVLTPGRTVWRIDYARLVHSPSFRRLQGKTQLFPGESDFFRNRLTHSIEVCQIAKGIAMQLNEVHFHDADNLPADDREKYKISTDLVEFAALAHDLGHPPFGHNGEAALDECMAPHGGFEGNAQTFHILARLERKRATSWPPLEFGSSSDLRRGLNLTCRALAAVLKYDKKIPRGRKEKDPLVKGYYEDEETLVQQIREKVTGIKGFSEPLKTIECQIMDIADDIAYSTYDFEDAMKAGFTSPLDIFRLRRDSTLLRRIAIKVWQNVNNRKDVIFKDEEKIPDEYIGPITDTENYVLGFLEEICLGLVPKPDRITKALEDDDVKPTDFPQYDDFLNYRDATVLSFAYQQAKLVQEDGYYRTRMTSDLVGEFVQGVSLDVNPEIPALSKVIVNDKVRKKIESLKRYTFESHIETTRLKSFESRGKEIVRTVFKSLEQNPSLLPSDWRTRYNAKERDNDHRMRCISDFVAGMTDRYALEFFQRQKGGDPGTIFRQP